MRLSCVVGEFVREEGDWEYGERGFVGLKVGVRGVSVVQAAYE